MSIITKTNKGEVSLQEDMNIVIVGHVDHGKSTIIGRLLADTDSLPEGKLEQVKETCRRNAKPFEYAFLLDALKDEQSQGITIDAARCFFQTNKRNYIILDAPGHIEFLKNMVTGAARAEAALLVIDAHEGIQENSTRHGYLLSMLGIKQVAVLVNKMDLVGYEQSVYDNIVTEFTAFLKQIDVEPAAFIPISGFHGDNVAAGNQENMPWYDGHTVLDQLDRFRSAGSPKDMPFRMPVQGVYKFTAAGDERRIVAGSVDTGSMSVGDKVIFYPSGKSSIVRSIEVFNAENPDTMGAGQSVGFTLEDQIYIVRGELAARSDEQPPKVSQRIRANLFWLGKEPLKKGKVYSLKLGTAKINAELEQVVRVLDASTLNGETKAHVDRHDVAECMFTLQKPLAFDLTGDVASTSRFVLVDDYEISGGGIVLEALEDDKSWVRERVIMRNTRWEKSILSREQRAERYNQKPTLVVITGPRSSGKKPLAKALENQLFTDGRITYFLGIGNVLYGIDADIKKNGDNKEEHLRRLGEVANLMLDAGIILIVTAIELSQDDMEIIRLAVSSDAIHTVWKGDNITTDVEYDLHFTSHGDIGDDVCRIKRLLKTKGTLFNPYPDME